MKSLNFIKIKYLARASKQYLILKLEMQKTNLLSIIIYALLFVFLAFTYNILTTYSISLLWTLPPKIWLGHRVNWAISLLLLQSVHLIALLLASFPFSLALYVYKIKHAIAIAFLLALIGLTLPAVLVIFQHWTTPGNFSLPAHPEKFILSTFLDVVKFSLTLPALTWLVIRLSSSSAKSE